jgi:hypothetical protein
MLILNQLQGFVPSNILNLALILPKIINCFFNCIKKEFFDQN